MALRFRLSTIPETLQDFELSARQKYWAGLELMASGHEATGVYVLGYVAEMLLKNACFRFDGGRPGDPVGPYMGPARRWMGVYYPLIDSEAYHSVWFWAVLLRHKRRRAGRSLDVGIDQALLHHVRHVYRNWWVSMRYRSDAPQPVELQAVYNGITWLLDHYALLWR
jgi:hypothetical protein